MMSDRRHTDTEFLVVSVWDIKKIALSHSVLTYIRRADVVWTIGVWTIGAGKMMMKTLRHVGDGPRAELGMRLVRRISKI